jgi:hypothetical protein
MAIMPLSPILIAKRMPDKQAFAHIIQSVDPQWISSENATFLNLPSIAIMVRVENFSAFH